MPPTSPPHPTPLLDPLPSPPAPIIGPSPLIPHPSPLIPHSSPSRGQESQSAAAGSGAYLTLVGQGMEGVLLEVEGDGDKAGGLVGEVLVGGPQVARGYLGQAHQALSHQKFWTREDGSRWFRTGDLGRWVLLDGGEAQQGIARDREACLEVLGRKDLQVKLRGVRIEVEEIEAVLACSPMVRGVAVTVIQDPPRLVAWLHLRPSSAAAAAAAAAAVITTTASSPSPCLSSSQSVHTAGSGSGVQLSVEGERVLREGGETALRLLCLERMPLHQVPSCMVAVERLPLTSNGKVDRGVLSLGTVRDEDGCETQVEAMLEQRRKGAIALASSDGSQNVASAKPPGAGKEEAGEVPRAANALANAVRALSSLETEIALVWQEVLGLDGGGTVGDAVDQATRPKNKCLSEGDANACRGGVMDQATRPGLGNDGSRGMMDPPSTTPGRAQKQILVGPNDNWFSLGGDSVLGIRMLVCLDARLGALALLPASGVGGGGRIPGGGYAKAAGKGDSASADRVRVWMCGLHRKPRLRDFSTFIDWSLTASPAQALAHHSHNSNLLQTAQTSLDHKQGGTMQGSGVLGQADAWGSGMLAALEAALPAHEDTTSMRAYALAEAARHGHVTVVECLLAQSGTPSTLNPQPSTLNPQPSNPQPSALNPARSNQSASRWIFS